MCLFRRSLYWLQWWTWPDEVRIARECGHRNYCTFIWNLIFGVLQTNRCSHVLRTAKAWLESLSIAVAKDDKGNNKSTPRYGGRYWRTETMEMSYVPLGKVMGEIGMALWRNYISGRISENLLLFCLSNVTMIDAVLLTSVRFRFLISDQFRGASSKCFLRLQAHWPCHTQNSQ